MAYSGVIFGKALGSMYIVWDVNKLLVTMVWFFFFWYSSFLSCLLYSSSYDLIFYYSAVLSAGVHQENFSFITASQCYSVSHWFLPAPVLLYIICPSCPSSSPTPLYIWCWLPVCLKLQFIPQNPPSSVLWNTEYRIYLEKCLSWYYWIKMDTGIMQAKWKWVGIRCSDTEGDLLLFGVKKQETWLAPSNRDFQVIPGDLIAQFSVFCFFPISNSETLNYEPKICKGLLCMWKHMNTHRLNKYF